MKRVSIFLISFLFLFNPVFAQQLTGSIYPSSIFINEILPSPEGEDAEEEWSVATKQHSLYL